MKIFTTSLLASWVLKNNFVKNTFPMILISHLHSWRTILFQSYSNNYKECLDQKRNDRFEIVRTLFFVNQVQIHSKFTFWQKHQKQKGLQYNRPF